MTRWIVLAVLLGAICVPGLAASPSLSQSQPLVVEINGVDVSNPPQTKVTVTVLDQAQRPILNLAGGAFNATLDGRTARITGVGSASDPGLGIGVVLTFDVSGSMAGAPVAEARDAGKDLVAQLGPEDQAAVLAFSDSVKPVQPFTGDHGLLAKGIDALEAGGNTALYGAVVQSTQTARTVNTPRHAVVLLTDGKEYGGLSQVDAAGSLAAVNQGGVPFFVVGLGSDIDQSYLSQLASSSQGQLWLAPGPETLRGLYQQIGSILRHQYVLTVDVSALGAGSHANMRIDVTYQGAAGSASAVLALPGLPAAPLTPAANPTEVPKPEAQPAAQGSGGTSPWLFVIVAVALLTAGLGTGAFWLRRRRGAPVEEDDLRALQQSVSVAFPGIPSIHTEVAGAWLELSTPPGDQRYPVGEWPMTIGFTSDCDVCLPDGADRGWARARVWRREGHYMLHTLSRMGGVLVSGRPTTWAVLEDGDELQIGDCRLTFRLGLAGSG